MKFMQAKAVLFLMLLFLSLSVIAAVKRVSGVPVIKYSIQRMGIDYETVYYIYKYGGVYGGRYFVSTTFGQDKANCVLDDNNKCKGFDTPELALNEAISISQLGSDSWTGGYSGYSCKVDKVDFVVNCGYLGTGKDDTGGDGSTGSGTGSLVDNGNGNSNNDEKPPKPDPNQCGKTILGVWVPMPCDKVDDSENTADSNNSGSGNSSGGGSDNGSTDGGNSDSNSDDKNDENNENNGNTDYVPPKEPSCSSNNPSRNMCNSDKMTSHGDYVYSCVKDKDGKPEYYNFWVSKGVGNIEYCDDGSAHVTVKEGDTYNITIYNNYNSKDDALNADKNSSSTDDIYEKFDRDRRNKERERDKNNSSTNADNNAASQPSSSGANGAGASNGSVGGSANGSGSGSGSCEEGEDTLGCVPVGSQSDVKKAIDAAIGGISGDFGIGEKEININSFKKGSDFVESGTCPPPKTVVILRSTHEISYQSFCDAALKIRPFVIFMAMFVAFTIVYIAILSKD